MSAENPRPGPEKTDQIRNKPVLTQKESEAAWLVWKRLNAAVGDRDEVSCEPLRPAGPSGLTGPGTWSGPCSLQSRDRIPHPRSPLPASLCIKDLGPLQLETWIRRPGK